MNPRNFNFLWLGYDQFCICQSVVNYMYFDNSNHRLNYGLLACTPWVSFIPTEASARSRRVKKVRLSLVVAGDSVQDSVCSSVWKKHSSRDFLRQ